MISVLERPSIAAIEAALGLPLNALPSETIFHLDGDRATKGVESEDRVIGPNIRLIDSDLRNEIPVHCVPKRFVEADAVLVELLDLALDLVESRAFPKGITLQVYRPAGRPQYATDSGE